MPSVAAGLKGSKLKARFRGPTSLTGLVLQLDAGKVESAHSVSLFLLSLFGSESI